MSRAVICAPLAVERWALRGTATPVVRTGRGPINSRRSADILARDAADTAGGPRGVLVAGVAGGVAPHVRAGDLVVATEVRGPAGERVGCRSAHLLAGELRRLGLTVHTGPIACRPDVVTSAEARRELAAKGAIAVDTESLWLAPRDKAPFAVVRAITDDVEAPLWGAGTVPRGAKALARLRATVPALDGWATALGRREVLLANPRSFCAGVDRAIDVVARALDRHGAPVYVRRQIVHNSHVVADLERRGAVFVAEVDDVPDGGLLVLAAHGVAPAVRERAEQRGLNVIDATCPLVAKVHSEVRRYAARGDTVFLIGHADHEEVEGTVGEAPDNVVVVADTAAAATVTAPDPERVAYAMQTTLAVDEAGRIADVLQARFPALVGPRRDDICYATTNRQEAVRELARRADVVLVLGSANSSNSLRLVEVAGAEGVPAHLVDDPGDVRLRWLAGTGRVGVTAGASAPPHLVDGLIRALAGLGPVAIDELSGVPEDVRFSLPKEVT